MIDLIFGGISFSVLSVFLLFYLDFGCSVVFYYFVVVVEQFGAVIWGVQHVWGEENVPENTLSQTFLDPSKRAFGLLCRGFLYRKTEH